MTAAGDFQPSTLELHDLLFFGTKLMEARVCRQTAKARIFSSMRVAANSVAGLQGGRGAMPNRFGWVRTLFSESVFPRNVKHDDSTAGVVVPCDAEVRSCVRTKAVGKSLRKYISCLELGCFNKTDARRGCFSSLSLQAFQELQIS